MGLTIRVTIGGDDAGKGRSISRSACATKPGVPSSLCNSFSAATSKMNTEPFSDPAATYLPLGLYVTRKHTHARQGRPPAPPLALVSASHVGNGDSEAALGGKARADAAFLQRPKIQQAAMRAGQQQGAVRRKRQLPCARCIGRASQGSARSDTTTRSWQRSRDRGPGPGSSCRVRVPLSRFQTLITPSMEHDAAAVACVCKARFR